MISDTTGQGASEYIGFEGYGVVNQSGGTNSAEDLILGDGNSTSPGRGTYNLSGGTLTVCCSNEVIGQGTDTANLFKQTGGVNSTLSMILGNSGTGTYSLSAGTLNVGNLVLGQGSGTISGTFDQTGGVVNMIFTLDGYANTGTLTVAQTGKGSYALTAGTLNAGNEYVAEGMGSTGTFTQGTGSTNSMAKNDTLYVGYGGKGTYTMNGGTLKASQEVVGGGNGINSGNGTLTEKGGTNTITASSSANGNLEIGDVATGTYNLDGGALTAVSLAIGTTGSMVADKAGTAALTFKISGTTTNDGKMSFTDTSASLGAFTNDGSLTVRLHDSFRPRIPL